MNENSCYKPVIHMKHRRMFWVWYREFYISGVRLLKLIQQVNPIAKENNYWGKVQKPSPKLPTTKAKQTNIKNKSLKS